MASSSHARERRYQSNRIVSTMLTLGSPQMLRVAPSWAPWVPRSWRALRGLTTYSFPTAHGQWHGRSEAPSRHSSRNRRAPVGVHCGAAHARPGWRLAVLPHVACMVAPDARLYFSLPSGQRTLTPMSGATAAHWHRSAATARTSDGANVTEDNDRAEQTASCQEPLDRRIARQVSTREQMYLRQSVPLFFQQPGSVASSVHGSLLNTRKRHAVGCASAHNPQISAGMWARLQRPCCCCTP